MSQSGIYTYTVLMSNDTAWQCQAGSPEEACRMARGLEMHALAHPKRLKPTAVIQHDDEDCEGLEWEVRGLCEGKNCSEELLVGTTEGSRNTGHHVTEDSVLVCGACWDEAPRSVRRG